MARNKLTGAQYLKRAEVEGILLYGISVLINEKLIEMGVQKDGKQVQIRSQMMYNYDKSGLICKGVKGVYTAEQALEFVEKYTTKVAAKNVKVDEVKVDEECEGQLELI